MLGPKTFPPLNILGFTQWKAEVPVHSMVCLNVSRRIDLAEGQPMNAQATGWRSLVGDPFKTHSPLSLHYVLSSRWAFLPVSNLPQTRVFAIFIHVEVCFDFFIHFLEEELSMCWCWREWKFSFFVFFTQILFPCAFSFCHYYFGVSSFGVNCFYLSFIMQCFFLTWIQHFVTCSSILDWNNFFFFTSISRQDGRGDDEVMGVVGRALFM